ncbi:MAG: ABC transporter ATP-binding protein [Parvibaculaceae bacterium]
MSAETPLVLDLQNINKTFMNGAGEKVHAVKDASISIAKGETVALVGESGSGKSTLGRIALGLIKPDGGTVRLHGQDLSSLEPGEFRETRTTMQPVFQDPTSSLNPRRRVWDLLKQASYHHKGDFEAYAVELLNSVGLRPGSAYLQRLPHELSGGQRQRLSIARALAMRPTLIIADEALSGADVSIRGQILNLLLDIRRDRGVAYLMITHDISVARAFAHRVAVMMRGEIVESGDAMQVLTEPQHPYTKRLLAAVPEL